MNSNIDKIIFKVVLFYLIYLYEFLHSSHNINPIGAFITVWQSNLHSVQSSLQFEMDRTNGNLNKLNETILRPVSTPAPEYSDISEDETESNEFVIDFGQTPTSDETANKSSEYNNNLPTTSKAPPHSYVAKHKHPISTQLDF